MVEVGKTLFKKKHIVFPNRKRIVDFFFLIYQFPSITPVFPNLFKQEMLLLFIEHTQKK